MSKISTDPAINASFAHEFSIKQGRLAQAKSLIEREVSSGKDLDKAAGGFEALLLHEMLQSMWATVDSSGLLGEDSNEAQLYQDMFHQAIADTVAEGQGIGVKDFVRNEILRLEKASK